MFTYNIDMCLTERVLKLDHRHSRLHGIAQLSNQSSGASLDVPAQVVSGCVFWNIGHKQLVRFGLTNQTRGNWGRSKGRYRQTNIIHRQRCISMVLQNSLND